MISSKPGRGLRYQQEFSPPCVKLRTPGESHYSTVNKSISVNSLRPPWCLGCFIRMGLAGFNGCWMLLKVVWTQSPFILRSQDDVQVLQLALQSRQWSTSHLRHWAQKGEVGRSLPGFGPVGVPRSGGTPCCLVNHDESKSIIWPVNSWGLQKDPSAGDQQPQLATQKKPAGFGAWLFWHPMLREFSHDSVKMICIQMINMARWSSSRLDFVCSTWKNKGGRPSTIP